MFFTLITFEGNAELMNLLINNETVSLKHDGDNAM